MSPDTAAVSLPSIWPIQAYCKVNATFPPFSPVLRFFLCRVASQCEAEVDECNEPMTDGASSRRRQEDLWRGQDAVIKSQERHSASSPCHFFPFCHFGSPLSSLSAVVYHLLLSLPSSHSVFPPSSFTPVLSLLCILLILCFFAHSSPPTCRYSPTQLYSWIVSQDMQRMQIRKKSSNTTATRKNTTLHFFVNYYFHY